MENTYWYKQIAEKPLFPDLLWSRPESKQAKGKLLIIGGNAHGFIVPAEAYNEALKASVGTARVLLPDVLKRTVGNILDVAEYAPSTPSGSFNQKALAQMLDLSEWADGVLIAGELGRNAETAAVLENFINKTKKPVTITRDAVNVFNSSPSSVLGKSNIALVLSLAQLQKLSIEAGYSHAITFDMDLLRLVQWLHEFTKHYGVILVMKHLQSMFVACKGQVSSTRPKDDIKIWRVKTAALASVWWSQNPDKPFEAFTTSLIT